jgi:hypothetical protein
MSARKIRAEFFTCNELIRRDHGSPVAALAARKPCERTFPVVDHHGCATGFGHHLARRQRKMLRAK